MASRPRPSLLALFDPLTISESPSTPTRDSLSPSPSAESGSDKENILNTPKGSCVKTCGGGCSEAYATKCSQLQRENVNDRGYSADADLLGGSFSIEPKDNDASNLCLVQLADELNDVCNLTQDSVARVDSHREPLSEISIVQLDGNNKTPQSVARDKRLKKFGTTTVTPKSERKFAAGLSTPPISSPLAPARASRTPRSLLSPKLDSSSITHHAPPNAIHQTPEYPAPSLPFSSKSPALFSSTPAYDPKPIFQDPPSGFHGSSFEISSSLCMKKIDLSGDLLNDDLSFLERLEEDSLADSIRDGGSRKMARPSKPTPEMDNSNGKISSEKPDLQRKVSLDALSSETRNVAAKTPSRKHSAAFRRSISSSGLVFSGESNDIAARLASPIDLQPRTPLSSPFSKANDRMQALAPKKSQAVLRKSKTLSRSCGSGISEKIKEEEDVELGMPQNMKKGSVRARPSSTEIKPLARSQSFIVKQADATVVAPAPVPRSSISRPSIGRRGSVGYGISPVKPIASALQASKDQDQKPNQDSLAQSFRRLSISASAKPTPAKSNNFATTGRMGGARRVPLTANAPLFKPIESPITEVQSSRPVLRTTTARTGPQRPPIGLGTSATLGRSVSGPGVAAGADRITSVASTRTFSRSTSANSVAFSRSSFMTSSGSSRLPLPPTKGASKIPGPGARKAF